MKNLPNIGLPIILLSLLLIVFISRSSVNIGSGEAGVLFRTLGGGVVTDAPPKGEGFKIIAPWNRIVIYNVKQQEVLESMQVLSSNGLEITIDVSVLYQPVYDQLGLLHQTKGENYLNSVLLLYLNINLFLFLINIFLIIFFLNHKQIHENPYIDVYIL